MKIKVRSVARHRNGVSGTWFHVVQFHHEGLDMHAVVFGGTGLVAVLDDHNLDSCWRGDLFERSLRFAIRAHEKLGMVVPTGGAS